MKEVDNIDSVPHLQWILPQLHSASIRASTLRRQHSPSVSQSTLTLLDKEIVAPPPVSMV